MPKSRYSEEEAVQKPAGELLSRLGWDLYYAYDEEELGQYSALGRTSYHEVVLRRELVDALVELNEWLEPEECEQAADTLLDTLATDSLLQTNEKKYAMLRDGIPVERVMPDDTKQTEYADVFDFEHPERNDFKAVEELWVQGPLHKRRADLVGFVNGVPLMFVEFKCHDKDVLRAYEDNYTDYQDTIPQLFHFNAFVMLSNGLEAKVGTLGSKYEFFHEWKRLAEGEQGKVDLETMLLGMCNKRTFMDLFENFILFDHSGSKTVKILARNHQYMGVNDAVEAYRDRKLHEGKLGVFWHTQGSGKSYSMVFFARKVRRKFEGSPTFLVVTDRDELNRQIASTFAGCGCLEGEAKGYIATSGDNLRSRLSGNPSFVFTLIQKFNKADTEPIRVDHDIVIISDEAHRTNNGVLADNMVRMLPGACRIGFTGTPLFSYDNITERTFGGYVSVYDFATAVEDGATVPLFYENRSDILAIDNPQINDELTEAVEAADLDENQRDKLERDLAREYHIITSKKRLDIIARDFVQHYSGIWECGKAMFISVDKVTAIRMFKLVQKYWEKEIKHQEELLKGDTQQEAQERQRKIDWMRETEMCVVVSQEQNEVATFKKWDLDILLHREKMVKRELDHEFRDPENPFRVVFVCAMWLTGFDVKPLAAMYFDKPMKAHTLMQAIARANRVAEGKSNGLIVDYIGVVKALRQALADYTRDTGDKGGGDDPVFNKDELIARIFELLTGIVAFLGDNGFDLDDLITAEGFERLVKIKDGANAVSVSDEMKKRFGIMARELFTLFKFIEFDDVGKEAWVKRDAIYAVYKEVTKRRDVADTGDIMVQLQQIIDEHVSVERADDKGSSRFDISKIDFNLLHREFEKTKQKNLLIGDLRTVIERRLEVALRDNPTRADFFERYEKIIDEYNREQDRAAIEALFEKLMKLSDDLSDEQQRYVREGFTDEKQLAVFDMLYKDNLTKDEIKQVKELARELVNKIQERLAQMVRWTEKPETRAEVDTIIRDELFRLLPASYPDESIADYRSEIFEYFYSRAA